MLLNELVVRGWVVGTRRWLGLNRSRCLGLGGLRCIEFAACQRARKKYIFTRSCAWDAEVLFISTVNSIAFFCIVRIPAILVGVLQSRPYPAQSPRYKRLLNPIAERL